jgi:hypothetical protein
MTSSGFEPASFRFVTAPQSTTLPHAHFIVPEICEDEISLVPSSYSLRKENFTAQSFACIK